MAAFDDSISGSGDYADFDPAPALDSLIRRTTSGLPPDGPVTADMLVNRLARKMGQQTRPADLEPVEVTTPDHTPGTGTKDALDLASEGVPLDSLPDLAEFGTPVPDQPAAPPAAALPAASTGFTDYGAEFGKGVARGFKNMGSSSLKGIAAVVPEAGAQPDYDALGNPLGTNNGAETGAVAKPMEERLFFRGGKAVDEFGKDALAPAKGWEGSWTGDIGAGFGSMLAGIPVALIPGVGPLVGATLYTTAGMGEAVENAVKAKASDSQAESAGIAGAIAGATDVVDIMLPFFGRSTGAALGFIKRVGLTAIKGAIAEGGQEGIQQLIQNSIAKGIYKPDQDLFEDVPRSMAIAAIVGGTVAGGGAVVSGRDHGAPAAADQNAGAGAAPNGPGPAPGGPGSGPQSSPEDIADFVRRAREANGGAAPEAEAAEPGYTGPDPATMSEADWINAYAESRASHDGASDAEILKATGMSDADIAKLDEEARINAVIRAAKVQAKADTGQTGQQQDKSGASGAKEAPPSQDDLDYSIMRAGGWSHEDIEGMGAKQRAYEAKYFRDELGLDQAQATAKFKRPQPEGGIDLSGKTDEQLAGLKQQAEQQAARMEATINDPAEVKRHPKETIDHYTAQAKSLRAHIEEIKREIARRGTKGPQAEAGQTTGKREAPIAITSAADVAAVTRPADSEYTHAQGEANNRQLGHGKWNGLPISMEVAKGGVRKMVNPKTGEPVEVTHGGAAYGYFKGTKGADDMHVDLYMGDNPKSDDVYVIDEKDRSTGEFRQHKVMAGFDSERDAFAAYVQTSSKGPETVGGITKMSVPDLKAWLKGDTTKPLKKMPASSAHSNEEAGSLSLTEAAPTGDVPKVATQEESGGASPSTAANEQNAPTPKVVPVPQKKIIHSDDPTNLLQFIAANGGVKPDGDLRAMDAHKHRVQIPGKRGFFGLVKADGHSSDVMRRMAQEAGFFPADRPDAPPTSSVRAFYNAIEDGLRGQHTISEEELGKETRRQHQTRAESSGAARDKARSEAAEAIAAEYPDADPELVTLAAKIMADEGQADIDTAVERAAVRMVDGDPDYGVTADEISAIYGQGAIDEVRPQPASEDGEPAAQERDKRGRSEDQGQADVDGEDVPRAGAEVVSEEKPAEVTTAAWWESLKLKERADFFSRMNLKLPKGGKWDSISPETQERIERVHKEDAARQAEHDAYENDPYWQKVMDVTDETRFMRSLNNGIIRDPDNTSRSRALNWPVAYEGPTEGGPRLVVGNERMLEHPFVKKIAKATGLKVEIEPRSQQAFYHSVDLANDDGWKELAGSLDLTTDDALASGMSVNLRQGKLKPENARKLFEAAGIHMPSPEASLAALSKFTVDRIDDKQDAINNLKVDGADEVGAWVTAIEGGYIKHRKRDGYPAATDKLRDLIANPPQPPKGTAPEHLGNKGKPLDRDAKYPQVADPADAKRQESIDESIVPLTMSKEQFAEVTDEWASLFADPEGGRVITDHRAGPFIPLEEAQKRIDEWREHARAQGDGKEFSANSDKTVLSLFDLTGEWARPWAEAGYNVQMFDIQSGQDVNDFSAEYFIENFDFGDVYAILAACPCTDFASSGSKHFAAKDADGRTEASKELVFQTLRTIEYFKPKVWALENPVGRIENLTGLPKARMTFEPHHFGETYTKKTMLWGNFNTDLPTANVDPVEGSKMHKKYGGKSQATKNARSATPTGFSYAFFMANNYADLSPAQRLTQEYPEASGAVEAALNAGVSEARIRELMYDTYENYEYEDARNALISEVAGLNKTERTDAGEQGVIPGADKIGDGDLAQRKTNERLKPKVAQKPADIGLFGDEANQSDLLDRVEKVLGTDADKVAPVDIARAAELLAENEGMEPATAFQHAVIENAVEQGFITEQEAIEAYGEEVEDILESVREGAHRGGSDVEQERTAPVEVGTRGTTQAGELPGSGQAGEDIRAEGGADSEAGRADADTTGRGEAARDQTGDTAQDQPAARDTKKPIGLNAYGAPVYEDERGVRSYSQKGIRISEPVELVPQRGGGMGIALGKRDVKFLTEDEADGIPGALRDGDAAAGAEDVQPAGTVGRTGSAPDGESPGGGADVRGPDEGRTEGAGRVSARAGGDRSGRASAGGADRVSGERTDKPADRRTKRDAQQAADRVEGENYAIEPGSLGEDRSFRVKAADNIRALELAHEIVAAGRPATHEEQRQLALYVGWGGIKGAFPDGDGNFATGYAAVGARLKELLSPDEYDTARRSIQYAHYTAEDVVRSMWSAVQRLGFKQGQVFEPGMGVGNFAGMMPGDVAADTHYQGLELDHTTARIAKLLYPKYGVRQQDFTKAPLPENAYDLVIGNPPFADVAIKSDPKYKQGFLLHDYFFAKSIDAVRPGGLLAFVTSAGTMNKIDTDAREYLADRADLVGAIRLPGDAFKANAGTEVTTDIIFLRKRLPGEAQGDRTWTETVEATMPNRLGKDITGAVNRYFAEHPDMVLGEQGFFDKLYENRYGVRAREGVDFKAALEAAVAKLPSNVMSDWQSDNATNTEHDFETTEKKEGTFYIGPNGVLHHMQSGVGKAVERRGKGVEGGKSEGDIARIKGLIPVRDSLRAVYAADLAGDTKAADKARAALNKSYDAFVEKFGPINKSVIQTRRPTIIQQESARSEAREEARYASLPFKEGSFDPREMIENGASLAAIAKARKDFREAMQAVNQPFDEGQFDIDEIPDTIIDKRPNVDPFMDDPESYRLRAIERYDDASGKAFKSPVFSENIITRERIPEINSINDALLYSLSQYGRVNVPAMAELAKKSEKEVIDELGEQVFLLPGTRDVYQTRDEYLSGDVRKKLAIAQAAAEKNPELRRNVAALEASQPAPLAPSQIFAQLGMPWLPPHIIKQFGTEELGLESLKVQYVPAIAQWIVSGDTDSVAASTTWGTADRRAPALLSDALNRVTTKIYDTIYVDNQKKSVLNTDKTQAAQDKVLAIREKFGDWIWRDQKRADDLAGLYNEKYNNLVVREYDGSYLTTPGIASNWKWRPHQKRVISRIIQSGNTYAAHAVGAGKTSEFIGAVMEMRRLGLVRKPMITVPNHMLAQFTKEFYEQYPTARLAIADERRFHTDRRKQFIANVATDDLDAVIITHSAFGMIPVSEDFANGIVRAEIAQYRELLSTIGKDQESRITRSRIENQIEKLEQRLIGRGNKRRDQVFTFEEMGIDHLTVDEAHLFRKLDFSTQMSNLKGVSPEGSQMAWDLYVKAQYLNTIRPGRGLVLGSGTPVTNTMAELYTVSRYLQPDVLAERGLEKFDAWAGAFGDQVSELEQNAAGEYKPVSRFAKFINVAELSAMVRQVMDVVTSKQLEQYVVRPKLKNGKRQMNLAEKGPALEAFQQGLATRMRAIEARKGPPKKGDDIMLSVINDGRHAAIDLRLVGLQNDPSHPSKLDMMIDNMFAIWKASKNQKFYKPGTNGEYETKPTTSGPATQMAFVNLGLSGKRGFSVPDYIRAELVRRGVPKDEIAYIYDYPTSVAKQRLFNDMNEGKKRFLIGSTAKMATGVNAQRRLLAVHNMDPLWYPADDEQRNGRALRQGNMNPEIEINDYSTKGTYDSTMWGMMAKKARFIQGFFEGDPSLRSMDDLGEASQYEQAKALTTNDPRLIKLTELKQDLERADRRKAAFDNEAYALRQRRANEKASAEHYTKRIEETKADIAQRVPTAGEAFKGKVGKTSFDKRVDFGEALYEAIGKLEEGAGTLNGAVKVAEIGGFPIYATVQHSNLKKGVHVDVFMSLNGDRERDVKYELSSIGTVRSIEHVLNNLDSDLAEYQQRKDKAEKFLAESADQTKKKFEGDADIARLVQEVRDLEAELKSTPAPDAPGTTENQAGAEIDPNAMADAVSDAMQPMAAERKSEVINLVTAIMQHLVGNRVKLEFAEGMLPPVGQAAYGKMGKRITGARGLYSPMFHMIRLALIKGIDSAAFHEAYHAIEFQLQTPQERALMERETARLRDYLKNVEGLKKYISPSEIDSLAGEEVRAIAFEHYAAARSQNKPDPGRGMHVGVRHWFNRLWENLQKLGNGLRGLGFQTYEDIFKKAYRGDYAEAAGTTPREEANFEQDDALASAIFDGASERVAEVAKGLGYDGTELRTQIQDKFIRVKKAEQSVGMGHNSGLSAYQAESLYYGRTGEQLERLEQDRLDPMIEDMKTRDISLKQMDDYLYAKHARERNAAMDAINHPELMAGGRDLRGKGSGMSDAEADAIIEAIRAQGKLADYEAIERRVRDIIDETRSLLVASGLISQETADAWAAAYRYYVPLRGFEEGTEDESVSGRGAGFDTRAGETKKAFGRLSKAAGPLSYVMLQAEMAVIRAEKNRVGNTWLRFVRSHPDAARWTVDTAPQIKVIDHRTGLVTMISDPHWQGRDDVFVTKVGGRPVMIQHHGAEGKKLVRALKNMGTSNLNTVLKFFHVLTTLQSRLATQWNPNFTVPNLVRDLGEAFINLQAQDQERFIRIFAGHLPGAMKGSFDALRGVQGNRYADAFREFDKAGGRIRFFGLDNPEDIGKSIAAKLRRLEGGAINNIRDAGEKAVEGFELINGAMENATRLAAYMAAREVGMSIPEAASLARELTVNFNRKGEIGGAVNALYMFANASVQGTTRMALAMQHKRVRRAVYALIALGALASMLAMASGGDDDQGENYYAKIKPWIRDKNLIIMWPKGYGHDGQYIKIPLPFGFAQFFVLGARTAAVINGKDKIGTAAGAVLASMFDSVNPLGEESASAFSLIPSIFRPVAHIQANKNWNGNPLYPSEERSAKGIPDSEKSFKGNSAFAKSLASGLNSLTGGSPYKPGMIDWHPGSIDHVLETITGGLGKFIKDTVMMGGGIAKGEPFDATKAPIIRRFVGTSNSAETDQGSYYTMRDEARANGSAAVKAAQKDRRAGNDKATAAEDFLKNNQNSIRGEEIFKAADNQMKALRERENRVTNDKSMLDDERAASLKEVRSRMREVQNTARKRYMDMKKEPTR